MMMSTLTVLVFCLPPDSGEKIALGVTVLLAFSVFMLAIAEKMPEKVSELDLILRYSEILGVRPTIGMRVKLASPGAGRWQSSQVIIPL